MRAAVASPSHAPCCSSSSAPHPIGAARPLPLSPPAYPTLPPRVRHAGRLATRAAPSDAVEVGQLEGAGGGGVTVSPSSLLAAAAAADAAGTTTPATAAAIAELRSAALAIPDRGVYGTKTPAKDRVLAAVAAVEELVAGSGGAPATALPGSPCVCADSGAWAPTAALPALAGSWTVLWSTVTCTGSRRVKLGLKTAVSLKGVAQAICLGEGGGEGAAPSPTGTATNTVSFSLLFMAGAPGALTLEAAYETLSPTRVGIALTHAALTPPALDALFGPARLPLLLEIFNPEGWLDTTFVGGGLRVGRDDKGHVFVLEREAGAAGA